MGAAGEGVGAGWGVLGVVKRRLHHVGGHHQLGVGGGGGGARPEGEGEGGGALASWGMPGGAHITR